MLKSKLMKKWTKSLKAHQELLFRLLVCRKAKYILQKPTIQLAKLKNRNTNKQGLRPPHPILNLVGSIVTSTLLSTIGLDVCSHVNK
jgi:hypothetical protein